MRLDFTPRGIRVPGLGLWLDPLEDCEMAWVSHGHRDHARGTHGCVLATPETIEIYRIRYGEDLSAPRALSRSSTARAWNCAGRA